jgi:hypothetical protein
MSHRTGSTVDNWGVDTKRSMWPTVRWPLLLLAFALAGIAIATVLDQTSAREYALVIGAPALTVLLPIALVWLAIAAVVHIRRRR